MNGVLLWVKVHSQRGPVVVVLAGMGAEVLMGSLPVAFPFNPLLQIPVRLSLLLPLLTIGGCILLLFSDLGWLERRTRHLYRSARAAWIAAVAALAISPAMLLAGELGTQAALRNRAILFAVGVIFALVAKPQLAVIPGMVLLSFGMLTNGRSDVPVFFGSFLLEPEASGAMQLVTVASVLAVGTIYSCCYPGLQGSRES